MKPNTCVNIGQYPKWFGRLLAWFLKRQGVNIRLYGRGKGSFEGRYNYGAKAWRECPRVAVYVYHYCPTLNDYHNKVSDNWRLTNRVMDLEKQIETLLNRATQGATNEQEQGRICL